MEQGLTKDDLRQFGLLLMNDLRKLIGATSTGDEEIHPGWIKSGKVRKMLDMSPNTLQNLRVTGVVRFKKVMGSYYYNKADLQGLFNEEGPGNDNR